MTAELDEPPVTEDDALDQALRQVAQLTTKPLSDHAAVYRQAQEALQQFLSTSSAQG
ncbi:MAG: hypothetical protein LBV00_10985 [Propionibacteriaceae bacterium]|jgi:hypothetical protein|nr:hypothetical protein [Propionibacteriaceae bacterium]